MAMPIDYTKRSPAQPETPVPVSPTKVSLTKSAPTVSLVKGADAGLVRVNLNWTARPAGHRGGAIDLDLGCLYEYVDGSKGVVQALGNSFRDRHVFGTEPICWLDGDDRSGSNSAGENLFVDLRHIAVIRRILVFAFIYEGAPSWAAADAVVNIFPTSGPQIEIRLDDHDERSSMCAIALLDAGGLIRREVRYIQGSQAGLDRAYGWGMNWTSARK